MITQVPITTEESQAVEALFIKYTGYCNILGYLAKYGTLDTDIFDKKWEEAVQISYELETLKKELDMKYHPQDGIEYTVYEFDFKTKQMVYKT